MQHIGKIYAIMTKHYNRINFATYEFAKADQKEMHFKWVLAKDLPAKTLATVDSERSDQVCILRIYLALMAYFCPRPNTLKEVW